MSVVLTVSAWLLAGVAASWATTSPDANWRQWIPMAAVFGPMWLVIAYERRRAAEATESDRALTHLFE